MTNKNSKRVVVVGTCGCGAKNVELPGCWFINYGETPACDNCCEQAILQAEYDNGRED